MPDDGTNIFWNVASLNILVHDVTNFLYYEHWTDKPNINYINFEQYENCLEETQHENKINKPSEKKWNWCR